MSKTDVNEAMGNIQNVPEAAEAVKELLRGAIIAEGDIYWFGMRTNHVAESFAVVLDLNVHDVAVWAADIAKDLLSELDELNRGDITVNLDTFAQMQFPSNTVLTD